MYIYSFDSLISFANTIADTFTNTFANTIRGAAVPPLGVALAHGSSTRCVREGIREGVRKGVRKGRPKGVRKCFRKGVHKEPPRFAICICPP